jgi:hypothetical protein
MEALRDLLESDEIVEEYNAAVERITELKTAEPKIEGAPFILVNEFDQASNLWIEENRERHKQPLAVESPLISLITPTTQTIGGMIANVKFAEDELIRRVVPDTTILAITCNFGKQVYPGWTMPVKSSTKTKQRQDKKKARRKQQGDGSQMNSQISFIIRATHEEYAIVDGVMWIPTGTNSTSSSYVIAHVNTHATASPRANQCQLC